MAMTSVRENVTHSGFQNLARPPTNVSDFMTSALDDATHQDMIRFIFRITFFITINGLISILGIFSNIINIIVFYRQGVMSDSSTTSLSGLAVSDLCCTTTSLWYSTLTVLQETWPPWLFWHPTSFLILTAGWPHTLFTRITCWITAYVALERCICVTFPFKVKMLFNPKRSLCVIIGIFCFFLLAYTPIFCTHQLKEIFLPSINASMVAMVRTGNSEKVRQVSHYINGLVLPTCCMFFIMVCTRITVSRINSSGQWRKSVASSGTTSSHHKRQEKGCEATKRICDHSDGGNNDSNVDDQPTHYGDSTNAKPTNAQTNNNLKERKVTRMVTLICAVFLACNIPSIIIVYVRFLVLERGVGGGGFLTHYSYTAFYALHSFHFTLESLNSAINIVVYYTMSTRYKLEFNKLFFTKAP